MEFPRFIYYFFSYNYSITPIYIPCKYFSHYILIETQIFSPHLCFKIPFFPQVHKHIGKKKLCYGTYSHIYRKRDLFCLSLGGTSSHTVADFIAPPHPLCSALLIYLFSARHGCVYRYSWEIFGSDSNHSQSEWVLRYPSPSNHIQEGARVIITSKNRETDV